MTSCPVSSPATRELTPTIMPKPSQVTGPTTTSRHISTTSAAATRGLSRPASHLKSGYSATARIALHNPIVRNGAIVRNDQ